MKFGILICILVTVYARPEDSGIVDQPSVNDRVRHKEYEIPEDAIIQLPVGRFPEPVCDYSVHSDGPDGPTVNGAKIGDPLYHKWKCSTPGSNSNMYCVVVHNCTVGNARISVPIIDSNGCTMEPQVIPDVTYNGDLEGGILAHAFSLGFNEPQISFNCGIRLLIKENGVCARLKCPKRKGSLLY